MSIIDSLLATQTHGAPIYGHTGFVLAMRREIMPLLQDGLAPVAASLGGMQIVESEHIPPGHYMVNGVSYRYTKPTIDEMVAEAKQRLAVALETSVETHKRAIECGFGNARNRAAMRYLDAARSRHPSPVPWFHQRQAA